MRQVKLDRVGLQDVLSDLREEDAAELRAAGINDPLEIFAGVLNECQIARAVYFNGRAAAAFGVRRLPGNERIGVPWMIATPVMTAHQIRSAIVAKRALRQMTSLFDVLVNLVHSTNSGALSFLRRLGFTIGQMPEGPGGAFVRATLECRHV